MRLKKLYLRALKYRKAMYTGDHQDSMKQGFGDHKDTLKEEQLGKTTIH